MEYYNALETIANSISQRFKQEELSVYDALKMVLFKALQNLDTAFDIEQILNA